MDVGGINVIVDHTTVQPVAQRLVCWDRSGGSAGKSVLFRTDGQLPYFRVPAGTCAGKPDLTLTPGGEVIPCPEDGVPTILRPTLEEITGLNPNTCQEIEAPTGLAVSGEPTAEAITVAWEAPAGAAVTGYVIRYRATPDGAWSPIDVPSGVTQATADGLTAGTEYEFTVQARQDGLLSPAAGPVTISTAAAEEGPE